MTAQLPSNNISADQAIAALSTQSQPCVFDQERASSYDQQFAALAPVRDALHLLIRIIPAASALRRQISSIGAAGSTAVNRHWGNA